MADKKIVINDEEIELNFGLKFASDVDNYKEEIAMMQGIDNIVIVATSLIKRKLSTLNDLLIFSLNSVVDNPESVAEAIINEYAEKNELEDLFTLFFTNVLANKFLQEQVKMNYKLIIHIIDMAKMEQEAKEIQMEEILQEMEKDMARAKEMMAKENK